MNSNQGTERLSDTILNEKLERFNHMLSMITKTKNIHLEKDGKELQQNINSYCVMAV